MSDNLQADLLEEICAIPCIDSHSHILPESARLETPTDLLTLFGDVYPKSELIAAGMPADTLAQVLDGQNPLAERWRLVEPYWERVKFTGFFQCIREGVQGLTGFSEIGADSVTPISEALSERVKPGFYEDILRQRCKIATIVLYTEDRWDIDEHFFVPLPLVTRFTRLETPEQLRAIEEDYDIALGSVEALVTLIENACVRWRDAGAAGIKFIQGNRRRLDFERQEHSAASAVLDGIARGDFPCIRSAEGKVLEDYLVFEACRAASEAGLALQFHTGMRAANNRSLDAATPVPMVPLLKAFPNARFDLSHAGFPYLREAAVLAKSFASVHLNMSWIHIISPEGARQGLKEWLRMLPRNKIIAFGDDLHYAEIVYGHLRMARENVAIVLAELVQEGVMSRTDAVETAKAVFFDNAVALYGLEEGKRKKEKGKRKKGD